MSGSLYIHYKAANTVSALSNHGQDYQDSEQMHLYRHLMKSGREFLKGYFERKLLHLNVSDGGTGI